MRARTDSRLDDAHLIVAAAARGIAVRCARSGADVSLFDLRPDVAAETPGQVRELGFDAAVFGVDVTDEAAVDPPMSLA